MNTLLDDIYPNEVLRTAVAVLVRAVKDLTVTIPDEPVCPPNRKTLKWHKWRSMYRNKESALRWLSMEKGSTFVDLMSVLIDCFDMKEHREMNNIFNSMVESQWRIDGGSGGRKLTPQLISECILKDPYGFMERMSSYYEEDSDLKQVSPRRNTA